VLKSYDFVAIGGGNAGLTAVSRVAAAGHTVALVDRWPIGGLCSLNGCNPKKVLVRSTEVLEEIRHACKFGIQVRDVQIDWSKVIDRKETFTSGVTQASERSLQQQGVEFIPGSPRFIARDALAINGTEIQAGSVLVATGSTPRPLSFEGAQLTRTSDDILALRRVPQNLVIIGAGVVAFEFGQVFARLGSRVFMLTPRKRALSGHDEELVEAVVSFSEEELGIQLLTEVTVNRVRQKDSRLAVEYSTSGEARTLAADFVLNAAGRIPSIKDLALEQAGVETDGKGIVVNEFLRSQSQPTVFAAGDAHGRMQLSPVASYEGRVVARNFLEGDAEKVEYEAIPRALYTIPPLASVGLTEREARARGLEVDVYRHDLTNWKVYAIAGEGLAKAKVISERGSGRILGAHLLGGAAGEEIHIFAMAIKFGIPAAELKKMVFAYPTLASALVYVFD
jgi:glutathione reductase (NADPH)